MADAPSSSSSSSSSSTEAPPPFPSNGQPQDARALLQLFADAPLSDRRRDFFGFSAYADAITELIENESTETPLTIALSAPWGAGKTSVARMVQAALEEAAKNRQGDRPNVICWFNAWMHDDAPHLGAAMAGAVAAEANVARPLWRRIVRPLPASMLAPHARVVRRFWLVLIAAALAAFVATRPGVAAALAASGDKTAKAMASTGGFALLILAGVLWQRLFSIAESAANFLADPGGESGRGTVGAVHDQLGRLIRQAIGNGRLVIFVDDLERCTPERAMEVCEVAAQLTAHRGVVTIFIADMHVIARSAEEKLAKGQSGGDLGRRFLEKIVQVELTLPPPLSQDMCNLLKGEASRWKAEREQAEDPPDPMIELLLTMRPSLRMVRDPAAWVPALAWGGLIALGLRDLDFTGAEDWIFAAVVVGSNLAFVGVAGHGIAQAHRRRRAKRDRMKLIRVIHEEAQAGRDGLQERVLERAKKRQRAIAEQLLTSYLIEKSPELAQVDEVLLRYPPALPRGAKRMLNTARVLTHIAQKREVFDDALTPEHLGEWIVINERWNALARRIEQDPTFLSTLESAAAGSDGSYEKLLEDIHLDDGDTLRELLRTDPKLGGVATRLLRCEPVSRPAAPPDAGRSP